MGPITAFFTYLIIWWTVLFAVLPWGNRQPQNPETGMAFGAPVNPNIRKKLLATTLVSFVILGVVYGLIESGVIDVRTKLYEFSDFYGLDSGGDSDTPPARQ